jgi:hypothetical protein
MNSPITNFKLHPNFLNMKSLLSPKWLAGGVLQLRKTQEIVNQLEGSKSNGLMGNWVVILMKIAIHNSVMTAAATYGRTVFTAVMTK